MKKQMVKKMVTGVLVAAMAMSMTACGEKTDTEKSENKNKQESVNTQSAGESDESGQSTDDNSQAEKDPLAAFEKEFEYTGAITGDRISDAIFEGEPVVTEDEHFYYSTYDNAVTVCYKGGLGSTVEFPAVYEGKPVRGIGRDYELNQTFETRDIQSELDKVTKVVLPETLWDIGVYAFEGFSALTSIEIPEYVVAYHAEAFKNCVSLTEIHLPKRVLYVGEQVFFGDDALTAVYVSNEDFEYEHNVFDTCPVQSFTQEN